MDSRAHEAHRRYSNSPTLDPTLGQMNRTFQRLG